MTSLRVALLPLKIWAAGASAFSGTNMKWTCESLAGGKAFVPYHQEKKIVKFVYSQETMRPYPEEPSRKTKIRPTSIMSATAPPNFEIPFCNPRCQASLDH